MAFVSTSKEIYIDENGSMLHAKCLKKDGTTWVASQLELDTFIGNNDGTFTLDGVNYSATASGATLDKTGAYLSAKLTKKAGGHDEQTFDLNKYISNEDGVLTYNC